MFTRFSQLVARVAGSPIGFGVAVAAVAVWAASGPLFGFSETWQLVINTGTTVVTFLMVFLIQSTQNRDTAAIQAKLDELVRVDDRADNDLISLERKSDISYGDKNHGES